MKNPSFKFENYIQRDFPVYSSVRQNVKNLFGSHYHRDAEIVKIVSGTARINTGNEEYILNKNDVIYFSPLTIHSGISLTDDAKTHSVTFDPSVLENKIDFSNSVATHCVFSQNHPKNSEINTAFDEIFYAYWNKSPAYKLRIIAGLILVSSLLIESDFILYNNDLPKMRTYPAVEYIKENYNKKINITELSAILNFCPDHFIRLFKEENKKTPLEYLMDYRIEKSLDLLSKNKYSITEIANMTGFSSTSHFIKVFKQKINSTPGKYQKSI